MRDARPVPLESCSLEKMILNYTQPTRPRGDTRASDLKPGLLVLSVVKIVHALEEHARAQDDGADGNDHAREFILRVRVEFSRQSSLVRSLASRSIEPLVVDKLSHHLKSLFIARDARRDRVDADASFARTTPPFFRCTNPFWDWKNYVAVERPRARGGQ